MPILTALMRAEGCRKASLAQARLSFILIVWHTYRGDRTAAAPKAVSCWGKTTQVLDTTDGCRLWQMVCTKDKDLQEHWQALSVTNCRPFLLLLWADCIHTYVPCKVLVAVDLTSSQYPPLPMSLDFIIFLLWSSGLPQHMLS